MDKRQHNWFTKSVVLATTAGSSGTILTSTAGQKWNLNTVNFGWCSMIDSTTLSLYEIDATNSNAFYCTMLSATSGAFSLFFDGFTASSTNTRLVVNTGATLSLWCCANGWTTGA